MSSAADLCTRLTRSGSKLFDTLMVLRKEFIENVILKKVGRRQKIIKITQHSKSLLMYLQKADLRLCYICQRERETKRERERERERESKADPRGQI